MSKFKLHEAIAWANGLTVKKYLIEWGYDMKIVEGVVWSGKLYVSDDSYPVSVIVMEK